MNLSPTDHTAIPEHVPAAPATDVDLSTLEEQAQIGTGGTADVTKMRAPDGTVLAVKQPRLQGTLDRELAQRVVSEAETWEQIDGHDGIVGIVDWGSTPVPWIALEYMDGGSLADRTGEIDLGEALWIGAWVANAVRDAHRYGVAHLDLKPENVLFRTTDDRTWDVPKVSDWGLSKLLLHHSQEVNGLSPRYSAPEQFDPETLGPPDDRTDIYQLGTVVYELLTGHPPFTGTAKAVMNHHLTDAPDPPTQVDSDLPAAVDGVLGTALAKKRDERYESMLDFRRDLTALFRAVVLDESVSLLCCSGDTYSTDVGGSTSRHRVRSDFAEGSSFAARAEDNSVLDTIRDQSQSTETRTFPWQRRTDAPGIAGETSGTLDRERVGIETDSLRRSEATRSSGETTEAAEIERSLSDVAGSLFRQLRELFGS
mgnify:CR=1 FL=1